MKAYLKNTKSYLFPFFGAMWIGVLAVILMIIPFDMISDSGLLGKRICEGILLTVFPAVFMFFVMKRKGYKEAQFNAIEIIICMSIVFLIQQLLCYVIGYAIYLAGGAVHFAEAIFLNGSQAMYEDVSTFPLLAHTTIGVPLWSYHLLMAAVDFLILLPTVIAGKSIGVNKRLKERKELNLQ